MSRFKFGDVLEWGTPRGISRWLIICWREGRSGGFYDAIWIGDHETWWKRGSVNPMGSDQTENLKDIKVTHHGD